MTRHNHRKPLPTVLVCLVILAMGYLFFLTQACADANLMEDLGIVEFEDKLKAPDFTLKDLNGQKASLKDFRGKIVFLNFWTTWCPPCRFEMPSMEKLHSKFKNRDFIILAIDLQERAERVRAFKEKMKLNFPILLDNDGIVGLEYGVRVLPSTYLVDRDGYIIGGALGPRDWASKEAFKLIEHLINKSSAP